MKEISVKAQAKSIPHVTELLEKELDALGCTAKAKNKICIAVDELLSNIAYYAYEDDGDVSVAIDGGVGFAKITFIDEGIPYNPLERSEPNTTAPLGEREIGGLGILIVKRSMDEIDYRRDNGKNILTIVKKW